MGHQLVYVCSVLSLLSMFPFWSQAQISLPLGNVSYWSSGSTVKLPWTYDLNAQNIFGIHMLFKRNGSTKSDGLAESFGGGNLTSIKSSYTIEDQATLVFQNANPSHNGTYSLVITFRATAGGGQRQSDVLVIILAPPKVRITCSDSCLCEGLDGSPPAWVSWLKDGKIINGSGYQEKSLLLEDIRKNGPGEYTCNATSYNLTVVKNITFAAPVITSFKSDKNENIASVGEAVVITCQASDNPSPKYTIFDGSNKAVAKKAEYTISKVSRDDAGNYTCLAKNFFGEATQSFHLNVTEKPSVSVACVESPAYSCICKEVSGNPPPWATCLKDQRIVNGSGYLEKKLSLEDIRVNGKGEKVFVIPEVSREKAGNYTCLAKNLFGNATSESFYFNVTATSTGGDGGSSGGLSGGAVAGIVIGVLALIVVVIFVVWCVWFKGGGKRGGREPSPSRDTAGPAGEENAYASVDKDKERAPASNPGPSSTNPPGGGGSSLPPVYSTVDKTKKTKKPPADAPTSVTYASLDPVALQPDSSRMHERDHQPTNYASIDLERLQGDLV